MVAIQGIAMKPVTTTTTKKYITRSSFCYITDLGFLMQNDSVEILVISLSKCILNNEFCNVILTN